MSVFWFWTFAKLTSLLRTQGMYLSCYLRRMSGPEKKDFAGT